MNYRNYKNRNNKSSVKYQNTFHDWRKNRFQKKLTYKKNDKPWNFRDIHKCLYFDISWVDKYPDKDWDFGSMHKCKYFYISWVDKYPDKDWDFGSMHKCKYFDISWVDKYPDKDWNFSSMHKCQGFNISLVDKNPDKPWNFGSLHEAYKFDLSWLNKHPDKPWDFKAISTIVNRFHQNIISNSISTIVNRSHQIIISNSIILNLIFEQENYRGSNFNVSLLDKFPNKPWDFGSMHKCRDFDISWVDKHPDKPWDFSSMHRCNNFDISWLDKYLDKPWDLCVILNNRLQNWRIKTEYSAELKKLDKPEIIKSLHVISQIPYGTIYNVWPGLFYQIDLPIKLQDLSGDIYYLENWFYQDDILAYCKETFPELGEFDIAIDSQDGMEKLLMASTTAPHVFKSHLFQNPDGPQGMIVYL